MVPRGGLPVDTLVDRGERFDGTLILGRFLIGGEYAVRHVPPDISQALSYIILAEELAFVVKLGDMGDEVSERGSYSVVERLSCNDKVVLPTKGKFISLRT